MVFLRIGVVGACASLCVDVPPNWSVRQLKRHLQNGLAGLLTLEATDMQLFAGSESGGVECARRWIAYSDADGVLLLHGHVTDRVQHLIATREMHDAARLCQFGFDDQLDAIHVFMRRSKKPSDGLAWIECMRSWLPLLPWVCLFFTLSLFVLWLDTVVTWAHHCQSNFELLRNLPWVVLSSVVFVASLYAYLRDIAITQARRGFVQIA